MHPTPKRTVRMWGDEVNNHKTERIVDEIEKYMDEDPKAWISFEIFSSGGDCKPGFALCDWIAVHNIPLQTIAFGVIESMAVPIFLMGRHRVIAGDCTFFLHPMASVFSKETRLERDEIIQNMDSLDECHKRYIRTLTSRVPGLRSETLEAWMSANTRLKSFELKRHGFAHEVRYSE